MGKSVGRGRSTARPGIAAAIGASTSDSHPTGSDPFALLPVDDTLRKPLGLPVGGDARPRLSALPPSSPMATAPPAVGAAQSTSLAPPGGGAVEGQRSRGPTPEVVGRSPVPSPSPIRAATKEPEAPKALSPAEQARAVHERKKRAKLATQKAPPAEPTGPNSSTPEPAPARSSVATSVAAEPVKAAPLAGLVPLAGAAVPLRQPAEPVPVAPAVAAAAPRPHKPLHRPPPPTDVSTADSPPPPAAPPQEHRRSRPPIKRLRPLTSKAVLPHGLEPTAATVEARGNTPPRAAARDGRLGRMQRIRAATSSVKTVGKPASGGSRPSSSRKVHPTPQATIRPANDKGGGSVAASTATSPAPVATAAAVLAPTPPNSWRVAKTKIAAVDAISAPIYGPNSVAGLLHASKNATLILDDDDNGGEDGDESRNAPAAGPAGELNVSKHWVPADDSGDEQETTVPPPVRSAFKRPDHDDFSTGGSGSGGGGSATAAGVNEGPSAEAKRAQAATQRAAHIEEFGAAERRAMSFCIGLSLVNFVLTIVALVPATTSETALRSTYYGKVVSSTPVAAAANMTATGGSTDGAAAGSSTTVAGNAATSGLWNVQFGLKVTSPSSWFTCRHLSCLSPVTKNTPGAHVYAVPWGAWALVQITVS